MKVVLSIKPEFAEKIFDGTKQFEYRRVRWKNKVTCVIVYASHPVQRVIGEFRILTIIHANLESLWSKTHEQSGITKEQFDKYFKGLKNGFAIQVLDYVKYDESKSLQCDFNMKPPQSFAYYYK